MRVKKEKKNAATNQPNTSKPLDNTVYNSMRDIWDSNKDSGILEWKGVKWMKQMKHTKNKKSDYDDNLHVSKEYGIRV